MIGKMIESAAREIGLSVSGEVVDGLELYAQELLKWNRKINLTAITNEKEIAIKHFVDALVFAEHVFEEDYVLDIGSGAGIPAIPLKIAKPAVRVVSVDAVSKKIQFQKHVARILGLSKFDAIHARVESLNNEYARQFGVITSRAFSSLELFVKLSAPLLADGGRLIAMKGPSSSDEISGSVDALKQLGFEVSSKIDYELPFNSGKRSLIVITCCKYD